MISLFHVDPRPNPAKHLQKCSWSTLLGLCLLLVVGCDSKVPLPANNDPAREQHLLRKARDLSKWELYPNAIAGYRLLLQQVPHKLQLWRELADLLKKQGQFKAWQECCHEIIQRFPDARLYWYGQLLNAALEQWDWDTARKLLTHISKTSATIQVIAKRLAQLKQQRCIWEENFQSALDQEWISTHPYLFRRNPVTSTLFAKIPLGDGHHIARRFQWPGGSFELHCEIYMDQLPWGAQVHFGLFKPPYNSTDPLKGLLISFQNQGPPQRVTGYRIAIAASHSKYRHLTTYKLRTWYSLELAYLPWNGCARLLIRSKENRAVVGEERVKLATSLTSGQEYWLGLGASDTLLPLKKRQAHMQIGKLQIFADRAWEACAHPSPCSEFFRANLRYSRKHVPVSVVLKTYRQILAKYPYEWRIWEVVGELQERKGDSELASSSKLAAKRLRNNREGIGAKLALKFLHLGRKSLKQHHYNHAIHMLLRSLQYDPLKLKTLYALSYCLAQCHQPKKALQEINIAAMVAPQARQVLVIRSQIYMLLKQYQKARKDLQLLISKFPHHPHLGQWQQLLQNVRSKLK